MSEDTKTDEDEREENLLDEGGNGVELSYLNNTQGVLTAKLAIEEIDTKDTDDQKG